MYSPAPQTIPFKFRRESSSASTSILTDTQSSLSSSSPLQSSSPLRTPSHLTRRDEYTGWQMDDYFDDLDGVVYDQHDNVGHVAHGWSRHPRLVHPLPYMHRLPSLMTKFGAHTFRNDAPPSCSPSSFFSVPQTTRLYSQEDGAIADDCEEYDLESMDIHVHETYFATSAERGRWLSSPIASCTRSQAIPPMRGHSSPVKIPADARPSARERVHQRSFSVNEQTSTSVSNVCDDDVRCSSPLPPSSPLSSPMSSLSFLGDDCEDDSVFDLHSNSDGCHPLSGTPKSNISTTCTSPIESTRSPPSAFHPNNSYPHSLVSCHTSPCPDPSLKSVDVPIHAPGTIGFEPDCIPSSLSQVEVDLSVVEPSKLPLSDTVNKPYPGQHSSGSGVVVEPARGRDGTSSVQSLSADSCHKHLDISLTAVSSSSCNTTKKRRRPVTGNRKKMRMKKRAITRSGSPLPNAKREITGSHATAHSEPPSKKTKISHCGKSLGCRAASSPPKCGEIPPVDRFSRLPLPNAVECCDSKSTHPCDRKTRKSRGDAESRLPTPNPSTPPVQAKAIDVEFHASLTGMLIEVLATSRATSMDCLALYLVLAQAHPQLAAERPKKELLEDITTVLEAGRARCGMFEKVNSSGEGSRDKTLEHRWFYVPERDEDSERAGLISAIMPRQKRKETKKYKQYYYRPLDKICRWDPEDAP